MAGFHWVAFLPIKLEMHGFTDLAKEPFYCTVKKQESLIKVPNQLFSFTLFCGVHTQLIRKVINYPIILSWFDSVRSSYFIVCHGNVG